jgi:tRNA G18 (ribose-2'-O)-methylase SpoU
LIHRIEREDDPRLDDYRRVGDPQWLKAHGLFVAEGRYVVVRLLASGGYDVESLLLTPAALRALDTELNAVDTIYVADQRLVNAITGFNFHRGCLAIARRPAASADFSTFATARRLVVLEGVANPDNIGGIFRSAAALGADGVILDPTAGDPLYRKAIRTSMGAVFRRPFSRADAWPDALDTLRAMGFMLVALSPRGVPSLDVFASSVSPGSRIALLAGSEGFGLPPDSYNRADAVVRIPVDPLSDSLNVVVAVSIALHRLS